ATVADLIAAAVEWPDAPALRDAARRVQAQGSPKVAERAGAMLDWFGLTGAQRAAQWETWRDCFFTKTGLVRGDSAFVNDKLGKADPDLLPRFQAEAARIAEVDDRCRAVELAAISAALVTLAAPVLQAYAQHKQATGLVDYDDLIGRTSDLLVHPGAAWVLYKLDGGLDHLLLDEVQDTAPAQWRIAHALTEEFFAGTGDSETVRTVFAVGDRKQSIYSFQGADAEEFDQSRDLLRTRVTRAKRPWRDTGLDVSFRSTAPVLALVDAVFAQAAAGDGVVEAGQVLTHDSDRATQAGRVELWPLTPLPDAAAPEPWRVPDQNQGLRSAPQHLAETLADWIREQTSGAVMLESKDRPLAPGDVMVLVRRRNAFAHALVRALKTRGVPVAGLDRLVLTEPPAVQDLLALCDALLLPQDDLVFACLLTSPLGGLTDDDLMALATGRAGPLWETLRDRADEQPHWAAAWQFFAALLARVDYVSPYALLAEALGPLGGRARLFARLGAEAAEPIDELLQAALTYGRLHPPSLQGFLHWLRRSGAEVKREPEAAGNLVRVMTVHGAKGLQAPLVILPD
ncbi:MAG: UvrD-helicase domain-containing protein, partial [Rhodospirillales bacterium]|nr:UvrD-helicase domain-containing protein [Rhodospirillales bacterium]